MSTKQYNDQKLLAKIIYLRISIPDEVLAEPLTDMVRGWALAGVLIEEATKRECDAEIFHQGGEYWCIAKPKGVQSGSHPKRHGPDLPLVIITALVDGMGML